VVIMNSPIFWDIMSCSLLKVKRHFELHVTYETLVDIQQTTWHYMWSDNKVRELTIVCLSWQQWTETSVWFDDIGISAFHSCPVVDLWQSYSKWSLLLSECVLVCHRKNVGASC
jgi:hypothetical protein